MEKIKVTPTKKDNIEIPYSGAVVLVNPVIKIEEQKNLRDVFVQSFFHNETDGEWDEQFAEFMFRRQILNVKTNMEIEGLSIDDVDELIWGQFFDKVKASIVNYNEVRLSINSTISNVIKKMEIDNSAGFILKGVTDKLYGFLEEMKNLSDEDLSKIKETASELFEKVKSEPMASVLMDANGNKTKKKSTKKSKEEQKDYVH